VLQHIVSREEGESPHCGARTAHEIGLVLSKTGLTRKTGMILFQQESGGVLFNRKKYLFYLLSRKDSCTNVKEEFN
jgi:hypothetical protein